MKKNKVEKIIFAGHGGQGILFMGRVLAYAAMLDGKHTTWMPYYGAEVRGGPAYSMVVVSDREIASPFVENPTSCAIMNESAFDKFQKQLEPKGTLFVNSSLVEKVPATKDISVVKTKATHAAAKLGNTKVANMVMLGTYVAKTKLVTMRSVIEALRNFISQNNEALLKLNEAAFKKGASAAR